MIIYVSSTSYLPENLLDHILQYYSEKMVDKFIFSIYGGKDSPIWKIFESHSKEYNIELHEDFREWKVIHDSDFKNQIRKTLNNDDWIVPADLDEFHLHPSLPNFPSMANAMQEEGADFIATKLIDRIAPNGYIPPRILPQIPLTEQFPLTKLISSEIMKCYTWKTIMLNPKVEIYPGHHLLPPHKDYKRFSLDAQTNHFKWYGDLRAKEQIKIDMYKSENMPWYKEQERLLEYLNTHNNLLL